MEKEFHREISPADRIADRYNAGAAFDHQLVMASAVLAEAGESMKFKRTVVLAAYRIALAARGYGPWDPRR